MLMAMAGPMKGTPILQTRFNGLMRMVMATVTIIILTLMGSNFT
jgi:hypothetical protein